MSKARGTGNGASGDLVGASKVSEGRIGASRALRGPGLFDPKRFL